MKMPVILAVSALLTCGSALAKDVYVKPHVTKNGTYVEGHHRTSPNTTKDDNYSAKGNTNPYTGKEGTKDPNRPSK